MTKRAGLDRPIGHQFAMSLINDGHEHARQLAESTGAPKIFDAFMRVHEEEPEAAFLHSALCAMSLPAKRPADETLPIIREDGKYALAINPKPFLQIIDGKPVMRSLGVPFGSYPRVALIYMLSQAVKNKSQDVYLGQNFTEWMRRLGYQTVSYGPRGTANLLKEQVDRLLACEWQIRWDEERNGETAFAVKEVKLSNEYAGSLKSGGVFSREIRLSEVFYKHLLEHAVPLNEMAIRELRSQPTALDLYAYLAYRLPRVTSDRGQIISWEQLAKHLGNESKRRFKQTIRETMDLVSAVYPNANADFSGRVIKLYPSPAPMEKKLFGPHLRLVGASSTPRSSVGSASNAPRTSVSKKLTRLGEGLTGQSQVCGFPGGSLSYGDREGRFRAIGLSKGGGWDVDTIAKAYRERYGEMMKDRPEDEVLRSWEGFCVSYVGKRGPAR